LPLKRKDTTMRILATLSVFLTLAATAAAQHQTGSSASAVQQLATYLAAHNESSIAARDPDSGAFIAAMFYPGVQLLVVSAKPPAPDAVAASLAAKNFRDVYLALQDGAAQAGRLFVQDLGANGLSDGGDSVDVVYDSGQQTVFDGNPRSHKLSEQAYRDAFTSADSRYAHMVMVLLEQARRAYGQ
jgi:hypothetical protein